MTTKQVTVTKYISCDGGEFNERSECEAHERETRKLLENQALELLRKKRELKDGGGYAHGHRHLLTSGQQHKEA